ncbi:MAG: hypothetical protein K0R23_3866 [Lacrimispora sp.]|jgi:hypothetical protein|nr:hypothetical protein [Lacrimispora sp.]
MSEKVRVSELMAGDILLLEPSEDKISKIIAWVTRSEVSHTALSCGPDKSTGTVIEETPPNAVEDTILTRTARTAYVMRLNPGNNDCQPVMNIAARYVKEELPYAHAQLPFIGLYCITNNMLGDTGLQGLVTRIVKLSMGILMELEDVVIYKGREAMMCSQFAYHCYKEAGEGYEIHLKENTGFHLIDQIIETIQSDPSSYNNRIFNVSVENSPVTNENVDETINQLYEALSKNQNEVELSAPQKLPDDTIIEVTRFCIQFVKTFTKGLETNGSDAVCYLQKLKDMYEFFISPGDLLKNTVNLTCMGTVDYEG